MNLQDTKSFIYSKTIWGIVMMFAGFAASKIGVEVQEADVKELIDLLAVIFEAGGGVLATYGRISATKAIK